MKKTYWLIIIIIILNINFKTKIQSTFIEKIDLILKEDERAITFINNKNNNYFLISNQKRDMLLILNYNNNQNKMLNKINNKPLNIMVLKSLNINNIKYEDKILLNDVFYLDKIRYSINKNILEIRYNDNCFCIYIDNGYKNNDLARCNFIYFYNTNNLSFIDINEKTDIVFYHQLKPLPTYLLQEIYKKWIDTYIIKDNELTIIKFTKDDYYIMVVSEE